ncbi:MazG family protein [Amycolatopsis sp. lyj-23]|uniref:MazG family protein n=1 Tax=Amycolatopsis sp. lyj-23 TaxID=2789283 RepID=UPI00397944A1
MSGPLIALIGPAGSGKSTAARLLAEHLPGYRVVESSAALLDEFERRRGRPGARLDTYRAKAVARRPLIELAEQLRADAPLWFSDRALNHPGPLIVVGLRCAPDLERLEALGAVFIQVRAGRRTRWARLGTRAMVRAAADPFDRELARFTGARIVVDNDGTVDELDGRLARIRDWLPTPRTAALREAADLMERLLAGSGGCPWNREQDIRSIRQYLVEETFELLDAIDGGDTEAHRDELGDLLFQVLFQAALRARDGDFDLADVCRTLVTKMVRRHPHVFAGLPVSGTDEVLANWAAIKRAEQGEQSPSGVPLALPALLRAQRVIERASAAPYGTAAEQLAGFEAAVARGDTPGGAALLGALLFSLVRQATAANICAEDALRDQLHSSPVSAGGSR